MNYCITYRLFAIPNTAVLIVFLLKASLCKIHCNYQPLSLFSECPVTDLHLDGLVHCSLSLLITGFVCAFDMINSPFFIDYISSNFRNMIQLSISSMGSIEIQKTGGLNQMIIYHIYLNYVCQ